MHKPKLQTGTTSNFYGEQVIELDSRWAVKKSCIPNRDTWLILFDKKTVCPQLGLGAHGMSGALGVGYYSDAIEAIHAAGILRHKTRWQEGETT